MPTELCCSLNVHTHPIDAAIQLQLAQISCNHPHQTPEPAQYSTPPAAATATSPKCTCYSACILPVGTGQPC